ncbi:mitogen-activated protein kinase 8 [Dorcoceras hygrometricum]|uniref:Mitogen-activated protein kinase 8 n=1 Tax=Dorcoceras hygrometricum TaxID=472368 RepID=A0A2Z7AHC1_9LAMI|nr:mitogen-activated protein kinase 8 [Dorcoceras hygrometricum]
MVAISAGLKIVRYTAGRVDGEEKEDFAQAGSKLINFYSPQEEFDAVNKLNEVQTVVLSLDSKIASMDSKVDKMMDIQTFMKHDSGIFRRALYQRMDEVVANVNSSQPALETSLVRQFTEHQLQIASDLDFVKMKLIKLVNHFKEMSDAKKGEEPSSKKIRLL